MGTLHQLIQTLAEALASLRAGPLIRAPEDQALERMALVVHEAMSQATRSYHSVEHALAVARSDDPVERLAGLFHDTVYMQVDRGIAPMIKELLGVTTADDRWRIERFAKAPASPAERRCLAVFGHETWQDLAPESGVNEALSALAATRLLEAMVPPQALLGIQAAIEATIPFRGDESLKTLRLRLLAQDAAAELRLGEAGVDAYIQGAARLANRDVQSFAAGTAADFLASTWLLFSELDPTLNNGRSYSVRTYRKALHAMERFLSNRVDPKRIFISAGPADFKAAEARRQRARQNLSSAIIYMRVKLFPVALVEAIAECTGGDAPLEIFLGDPRDSLSVAAWAAGKLDLHAQSIESQHAHYEVSVDAEIFHLLRIGRSGGNSFDLPNSPLGALLYAEYGGPYMVDRYEEALAFFEGKIGALPFLQMQDRAIVLQVAERIAAVSPTRRAAMAHLLRKVRRVA